MPDPTASLRIEYRLAEADVHHYCSGGLSRLCWGFCRRRKPALLLLVALGCFLVGICLHARGARAAGLALGTTLVVLAALAWAREAGFERRICRLARQLGLPRDLRLIVSPEGITEESGPKTEDPARTFVWREVADVSRVDHLTVIRLRPARGVLIVPDSAFATPEARAAFVATIGAYRSTREQPGKVPG